MMVPLSNKRLVEISEVQTNLKLFREQRDDHKADIDSFEDQINEVVQLKLDNEEAKEFAQPKLFDEQNMQVDKPMEVY